MHVELFVRVERLNAQLLLSWLVLLCDGRAKFCHICENVLLMAYIQEVRVRRHELLELLAASYMLCRVTAHFL